MASPSAAVPSRRSTKLLAGAALPVLALAAFVQVTGLGIDLMLLAAAVLILLGLERSVGDWIAEWFGPFAAAAIFGVLILAISWYFLSTTLGRSKTDRFFMEAERRGYRTAYYETPAAPAAAEATPSAAPTTAAGPAVPPAAAGSAVAGTKGENTPRSARGAAKVANEPEEAARPQSSNEAAPPAASPSGKTATSTGSWVGSLFRRDAPGGVAIPTAIAVSISPSKVELAHRTTITATVTASSGRVTRGTVEFMVNGLGAGRKAVGPDGTVSTTFVPQMAGIHEVRARFVGTSEHAASSSSASTLEVVTRR